VSTFVLIHGGWAGGWVWEEVAPLLEAEGHRVIAPDLPGHGYDKTPIDGVTLDAYVDPVVELLDSQREPVILVGHSSGGMVISQAGERCPDKIDRLVYVCAYLPADGQCLLDLGQTDPEQLVLPNLVLAPDGSSARIRAEVLGEALFADCPHDLERFVARAAAEPLAPAATPVKLTSGNFGRLPKAYIECLRDRGISLHLQRRMHRAGRCEWVLTMDTGHMPQYAAPQTLTDHLAALGST
jgi:pimeloyl-ACP methyl ester carboxylesterase